MTDSATKPALLSLAERVERATGPDRELDLRIIRATRKCSPTNLRLESVHANYGGGHAFHDSSVHEGGYCLGALPRYTASLDAAMQLVGDDPDFDLSCDEKGCWEAKVGGAWKPNGYAKAATPGTRPHFRRSTRPCRTVVRWSGSQPS